MSCVEGSHLMRCRKSSMFSHASPTPHLVPPSGAYYCDANHKEDHEPKIPIPWTQLWHQDGEQKPEDSNQGSSEKALHGKSTPETMWKSKNQQNSGRNQKYPVKERDFRILNPKWYGLEQNGLNATTCYPRETSPSVGGPLNLRTSECHNM